MPVESIDEIEDSSVNRTADGYTATRLATVVGVQGNKEARPQNAVDDPELPLIGDAHPTINGITLQSKTAEAVGRGQFKVRLEYTDPNRAGTAGVGAPAQVNTSAVLQEIEVTHDKEGKPLVVEYGANGLTIKIVSLDETSSSIKFDEVNVANEQVTKANILTPLTTVTFLRRTTNKPLQEAEMALGRINDRDFIFNGDKSLWLCTRVDSTSPDGGQTFDTTYEFVLAPAFFTADGPISQWGIPLLYKDRITGEVPEDVELKTGQGQGIEGGKLRIVDSNGVKVFNPYAGADFGQLELVELGTLF